MKPPLVKDWLADFLVDHAGRHPGGWPHGGTPEMRRLWSAWLRALIEAKATRDEADAASRGLATGEPIEHHPSLVADAIRALRRQAQEAGERRSAASDRTTAQEASHYCPTCGGAGLVTLYDRRYVGRRVAELPCVVRGEVSRGPFPMVLCGHCTCPLGRWMRAEVDDDVRRRIPDLEAVLAGGTRWQVQDPTRREDPCEVADARAVAKAMAADLAERSVIL